MSMSNLPEVLTPEEVAEYLKVSKDAILNELEEGRLKGFKVGTEWRCTDSSLLEYTSKGIHQSIVIKSDIRNSEYEETAFTEITPFDYQWPRVKEHFDTGYETTRTINGRNYVFKIGYANRQAAGQKRRRVVVWIANWPLVEFAGSNHYESDRLLASVIKDKNGKHVTPTAKIPDEYKEFRIAKYNSIVQGPFANRNMAVIVSKDELADAPPCDYKSTVERSHIELILRGIGMKSKIFPSIVKLTPYYSREYGEAWLGDAKKLLRLIPKESVDLIVTSPPYALLKQKHYGNEIAEKYIRWFRPFAKEFYRILKNHGSFVLNISGSWNEGSPTKSLYQ